MKRPDDHRGALWAPFRLLDRAQRASRRRPVGTHHLGSDPMDPVIVSAVATLALAVAGLAAFLLWTPFGW